MPPQTSTPRFRPVIRVFVSSTFSDLKAERNALQAQVFPRLEQLCAQNGFQFQAIDLRWGVSSEAGLDHRTMRICFDELRRAQEISPEPNFLVLLGNRYGWRPLPEEISTIEFDRLAAAANCGGENQPPIPDTHGKTATQVLRDWYRCDENVVVPDPPETSPDRAPLNYLLQPRTQYLGDGRNYTRRKDDLDTQDWMDVQQVLWRLINAAFPAESLDHRFHIDWSQHVADVNNRQHPKRAIPQIARFQASATEQEIWCGALSAANAERHVIACFREIGNRDDFAPADVNDFFDLTESGQFDAASAAKQSALKESIRQRLGDQAIVPIPFSWLKRENGKVIVDTSAEDIRKFCESVENQLRPIIERQFEEYWNKTAQASAERAARELKIEQDEHERFGRERGGAKSFVGRQTELQAISDYLQNDSPWSLVVHGASGCGKTALLARAAGEMQMEDGRSKMAEVIVRFIGVTPRSSHVRSLLRSLCQKLRERNPREGELPSDIKALEEELQEQFKSATAERPLILFLDALDQLSDADNGRLLNWIPTGQLPPHVKLVVSCLSGRAKDDPAGQPYAELTRRQLIAKNSINLDALSEEEASTLLFKNWLHQAGRKVSDQQRERIGQILKSKECCQPIYLKMLFEEAKLWHSYDAAPDLGESVPAILNQFFKRLQLPANHHPLLVERVLGYLAASRHGLAENEILEVLFADPEYRAALDQATEQTHHELPASATRIPIAIWSRLRFDLAPYLTERAAPGANVLTSYHRQVAEWVQEHFVKASEHSWQPHRRLADYFRNLADPKRNQSWKGDSPRPFLELPFHLTRVNSDELWKILFDFKWLQAKTDKGLVHELIHDYDEALQETYESSLPRREVLGLIHGALRLSVHVVAQDSDQLGSQMVGRLLSHQEKPGMVLFLDAITATAPPPWFRPLQATLHPPGNLLIRILAGHSGAINGVAVSGDGRLAISASDDKTLKVWDVESGRELRTLAGHSDSVNGVAVSKDGRSAVSASSDKTLKVWDVESGRELRTLTGHSYRVWGVAVSGDGRLAISASDDKTLKVWDVESGRELRTLAGHSNSVNGVAVSKDGRSAVSASSDKTLKVWDVESGRELRTLQGHSSWVHGVSASKDGRLAVSASLDHTLKVWDVESGRELHTLAGHCDPVYGVAVSGDGRLAVSASWDKTLKVWDVESGRELRTLQGHSSWVHGVSVSEDGLLGVSASSDNTLKVWDVEGGCELRIRKSHSDRVLSVSVSGDGRLAVSASWDKTLKVWDVESGRELRTLQGHSKHINGVAVSEDGRLAVSASSDNTLKVWDVENGRELHNLEGNSDGVALSGDGRLAVSTSYLNNTLTVWDVKSGHELRTLRGCHSGRFNEGITAVAVTPDGRLAISASDDKTLKVWDVESGRELRTLRGHADGVNGVAVSGDGRLAVSACKDKTLKVWDVESGRELRTLRGHAGGVNGVAVNRDGRLAVSASWDKTLKVWDLESGVPLATFTCDASALSCAFVNDRKLIAGDALGQIHFLAFEE